MGLEGRASFCSHYSSPPSRWHWRSLRRRTACAEVGSSSPGGAGRLAGPPTDPAASAPDATAVAVAGSSAAKFGSVAAATSESVSARTGSTTSHPPHEAPQQTPRHRDARRSGCVDPVIRNEHRDRQRSQRQGQLQGPEYGLRTPVLEPSSRPRRHASVSGVSQFRLLSASTEPCGLGMFYPSGSPVAAANAASSSVLASPLISSPLVFSMWARTNHW